MISVAIVFRNENLRDLALINVFTRLLLETHTPSGQHHLGTVFDGKHNIIVEHSQHFHRGDTSLFHLNRQFLSLQASTVGCDDIAVPVEGLFLVALQGAGAIIVAVYINETIALGHLSCGGRDQVNGTPSGVAQQVDAIFDCFADLHEVIVEVLDAVVVIDCWAGGSVDKHVLCS
ncbi:hypothetical protein cgR_5055 [Corynebacterium glutamicum R]|uniref:Uncharacterized protein n=1 Tax=Corynebacterium glutamicum (strain R) TaxID=340322 RepID=A0AB72VDX4_CORGB|nr:hypothetical protein cgR_5055 [Corynebacterium glutamicum R]